MNQKQALKLYVVLSKAYRTAADIDRKEISTYGLGTTEFGVLELLYHKGPQPIQKIASKILLTSGSMTYVISQLEKKGLIKRVVSEADRRVFFAELTEAGTALIGDLFPRHEQFLHHLMDVLSAEDAQKLIEQLTSLGKAIEQKNNRKEI